MKKQLLFIGLFLGLSLTMKAQEERIYTYYDKSQFLISWDINVPMSNDFIGNTSVNGGRAEYRYFTQRNISFGLSLGWNTLEEYYEGATYTDSDGGTVYTDMVRQMKQLPILAHANYYLSTSESVKPYIGVGIGTNYINNVAYFNIFQQEDPTWGFMARPEIGLEFISSNGFGFFGNAAYNYSTNSSEAFPSIDTVQGISFGIGVLWSY
ncbi:outer membrane beta-barrel protein [Flavobacteriaceae bacterium]|nr:outer membrane beta-barrel protein [Flavobacteriaceae bacterium]